MTTLRARSFRALPALLLIAVACGETSETTQKARGVLGGANVFLAMTIVVVVVALAIIGGAIGFDRFVRSRRALEAEPEEPEEEELVVAGIGVGAAGVPKWLYGFYVLIPVFALMYVLKSEAFEVKETPRPSATPASVDGGETGDPTIAANSLKFDKSTLAVPAGEDFTIEFNNQEALPHNVSILPDENATEALFTGAIITGPRTTTYNVEALEAGTYFFRCDVHPAMKGTVTAA